MNRSEQIERSIIKKYRKTIWRKFTQGINDYKMLEEGDKIAVCISGGKDSMLLAKLLQEIQKHGKLLFELVFLVMDPGYNEANRQKIVENAEIMKIPVTIFESDIFDVVTQAEGSPCYLCARMRRGHLYKKAQEMGCNKIALGHHFDDVVETILMGMLYGAQIQTMMPKLHSTNFSGMELIRPMYLIREEDIIDWCNHNELAFIQCACQMTENIKVTEDGTSNSKRQEMKHLIKHFEKVSPHIAMNIFRSVENVNLKTIVAYKEEGVIHHFLDGYKD